MATTKNSTAKKPARKTAAKKTAAKKVTAKKVTSKKVSNQVAQAAKVNSSNKRKELSPMERLKALNLFSAFIFAASAVIVALLTSATSQKLVLSISAPDFLAEPKTDALAPAAEILFDVQYRYVLAAILGLAAVGSLLLATKLRNRYEKSVAVSAAALRWVFLGITAGLTLELVTLMTGVNDIMTLKIVGWLIVLTTVFSWISDRDNTGRDTKWLAYVCALIAGALAWMPALGSLVGTTVYGQSTFDWYVYALSGVILLGSILIAINQYSALSRKATAATYSNREETYLRLDLLIKVAVVIIFLFGLSK